jgi:hypothetical protein
MKALVAILSHSVVCHATCAGWKYRCEEESATGAHGIQQHQAPEVDRGAAVKQLDRSGKHSCQSRRHASPCPYHNITLVSSTVSAGVQPGRAGSQSRDAEQLLRGLLLAASEQDVSNRIRGMALSHQQRLLQYLQGALRRLPTAPSQLDSFGDAYAPPQTAAKPGASDESALSLTGPPSVLPQLAAQASMTAAKVAAQLKGHPGAVCAACERPLSAGQHVWACLGQCCQIFHSACAAPMGAMKCAQCMSDRHAPSALTCNL